MPNPNNLPPVLPPNHERPGELRPPVVDPDGTRRYFDIEYASVIGFRPLRMDLFVPAAEGPVPVIVYIHGGAFKFGSRHENPIGGPIWHSLLGAGFAVAAVEYRLSGEALFPACLNDVKAAVRWLRSYGDELGIDPARIGTWGESAGGHLSAFLGLNNQEADLVGRVGVTGVSSDVQASVAWYPPTDFLHMDAQAPVDAALAHDVDSPETELIGGNLQENPDKAIYASPIGHVGAGTAPILLMHGTADREVPYQQSVSLKEALDAVGAHAELELVPGAAHVFMGVDRSPLIERSTAFLRAQLS
jgi:acetyl esterase/lipase